VDLPVEDQEDLPVEAQEVAEMPATGTGEEVPDPEIKPR